MPDPDELFLMRDGPLFRLLRALGLSGDDLPSLRRRILVFVLVCWPPLAILAALQGVLLPGTVALPFLQDVAVHVRFLVVVPLLLMAEVVVDRRIGPLVQQFLDRGLITPADLPRFNAALAGALRLRGSALAEGVILALVFALALALITGTPALLDVPSWITAPGGTRALAGLWLGLVSLPLLHFLLLRWYFRLFVWALFLWRVAKLDLQLIAANPDRAGGLGFLTTTVQAFTPLIFAHGALFTGMAADRIFFLGASLTEFDIELAVLAVFLLCLLQAPLLVFTPHLILCRLRGRHAYGTLAARYLRAFEAKWLRAAAAPAEDRLLGSPDLQSLADLGSTIAVVQSMRVTLLTLEGTLALAVALIAPLVPLVLALLPLADLFRRLANILL